jgi:dipeptidyl aminopeptidase/acylaminoacyl peptidase
MHKTIIVFILFYLMISACSSSVPKTTQILQKTDSIVPAQIFEPSSMPTPLIKNISVPTESPLYPYSYQVLRQKQYGQGEVKIEGNLISDAKFSRYLISYPSDGLKIYGFIDVPLASGKFPVVVALHGHINLDVYRTMDYSSRYADLIASNGYIVIHPNLRNYPPSDNGPDEFYSGSADDVLNLIAMVRKQAGQTGILVKADSSRIGIWGHSMGGGIALRVITIDPGIRAAVLYGAVTGNLALRRFGFHGTDQGYVQSHPEEIQLISPSSYYADIQAAVSIHHGLSDTTVTPEWSKELCSQLTDLGKNVECFFYPDAPHTFGGEIEQLFNQRTVDFFSRYLR